MHLPEHQTGQGSDGNQQRSGDTLRGSTRSLLAETELPGLKLLHRGKVRDLYDLGDRLLLVATDRISAFDSVLGSPIPDKGRILTQLSLFWFDFLHDIVPHHLLSTSLEEFDFPPAIKRSLEGRSMIVKKAKVIPIECVARGYLIGSGWAEYRKNGTVCGIPLPAGLEMAQKLEKPIFTPATKATTGHDENISFERMTEIVGRPLAERLRELTLTIYSRAAAYAETRGILIADTKFEFGQIGDEVLLVDEVLTPDSSRFWPADSYRTGISPPSFDKQFVRDWLEKESGWNKEPPAPALPADVVAKTRAKYIEAYERLTGKPFRSS